MKTSHITPSRVAPKHTKEVIVPPSVQRRLEVEYEKEARSILAAAQKRLTAVIADAGVKLRNLKKTS